MRCHLYPHKDQELAAIDEGKGIFLAFFALSFAVLAGGAVLLWFLVQPRLASWGNHYATLFALFEGAVMLVAMFSLALIILTAVTEKDYRFLRRVRFLLMSILVPLSLWLGKRLGIPKDCMRNSFIKVNNSLVRAVMNLISAKRLLILIPHCLQHSNCKCQVCEDIESCKRCRQCVIYQFVGLREKYNFKILVANGGARARQLVAEVKPTAIIAVACERELAGGIQDSYRIPVIGIPNIRPFGPCKDTQVDFNKVEETIRYLMGC
jgi:hypothetical protein